MANYDVVIVGSGLAGLTAGLFAARFGLSTLVLESNIPGGHLLSVEKIEDFPGFPDGIAGYELCPAVQRQAADQGAEFGRAEVQSVATEGRFWRIITAEAPGVLSGIRHAHQSMESLGLSFSTALSTLSTFSFYKVAKQPQHILDDILQAPYKE